MDTITTEPDLRPDRHYRFLWPLMAAALAWSVHVSLRNLQLPVNERVSTFILVSAFGLTGIFLGSLITASIRWLAYRLRAKRTDQSSPRS